MNIEIKIKKLVDGLDDVKQAHDGEWYDLRAAHDVVMKAGDFEYIALGVAIQLPEGYEAILAPRSSTPGKFGIICANSFGVIDNAFCGDGDEWKFAAYAIRDTRIRKNDRICQFRIRKVQPDAEIVYVDHLGNENRGGYGSTGTN